MKLGRQTTCWDDEIHELSTPRAAKRTSGFGALVVILVLAGCGAPGAGTEEDVAETTEALSNKDFDVDFSGCAEFAGIGLVPAANAAPLVPAGYTLAGGGGQALVVVRIASCSGAVIDGKASGATITSQVGITLQGPDGTADINNYTVYYGTNQARLHARFQSAGISADNTNGLQLSLSGSTLAALSNTNGGYAYEVHGTAAVPTAPPGPFVASWWANGNHGVVRSRTAFPAISFGGATTTLTTPAGSSLAALFGGTSLTFAVLDSYNTFASSHLEVRLQN